MDNYLNDIFKDLNIDGVNDNELSSIIIDRVVSNKSNTAIRIYAHGNKVISDGRIMYLENEMCKKMFGGKLDKVLIEYKASENNSEDAILTSNKNSDLKEKSLKETSPKKNTKIENNPNLIYGRDFKGDSVSISDLTLDSYDAIIDGVVFSIDEKPLKSGNSVFTYGVTDYTDSINIKLFPRDEEKATALRTSISIGDAIRVKGSNIYDKFEHEPTFSQIRGIKKSDFKKSKRIDNAANKRIELHAHTQMSEMDSVASIKDLINTAKSFGHEAIAITDHGVVQAFPEASHFASDDFKIIYGMEAYLIDDTRLIAIRDKGQSLNDSFVVFDLETTGLNASKEDIIEIGAIKVKNAQIVDTFSCFVNPKRQIPPEIVNLTKITNDMIIDAKSIEEVLPEFIDFCDDSVLIAHNAGFDVSCLSAHCIRCGIDYKPTYADTVPMAHILLPDLKRFKLDTVAKKLGISLDNHHRAVDDAMCTAEIFVNFISMFKEIGITTLAQLNKPINGDENRLNKLHNKHCIILAKNEIGRVNLYRLVSLSHIKYFHKKPRIPKSELIKHREGLIIGSACEAGELFQALLQGKDDEEINRLVDFYDYLEIQPVANNAFLVREGKYVKDFDDIKKINKRIVSLGDKYNKPVVATGDVHFVNPEDEIYRRIIMSGKKFQDADLQPPLFLHTTDEMLDEFSYLGLDKANDVVINNPKKIADLCEIISPTRPDKCPPVIEGSDEDLRKICYEKAHEIYGENLPLIVENRLEKELNSIISNGYAVMYIIAQKLVWKSMEDGYLVGSRGSVGSSFVATMAGISEVNPLSPHYICPNCHFTDFDSDEVKAYSGMSGFDMPDKICPKCGHKLNKDGFDIPFETFLGFKGDKEPDIDLNFADVYLNKAHKYTEVIFGKGQTYRAGTVGTVADRTAFGYVKGYYQDKEIPIKTAHVKMLANGCMGVKSTTGQHPGGIIVLPIGEEMDSFTPVQRPANDMSSDVITTHFDYHSIDANLLKLDILGKGDPSQIRMLEDLTGVNAMDIPLDDKKVLSLFQNTLALGLEPEDILGCEFGTWGIPEFGTDFAMGILKATQPNKLSDLVRIAGLSHGTDVWQSNAEKLIEEGTATISTAICTRDDIMLYLISMGIEPERAFKIMENVRKGNVAKGKVKEWDEWKQDMKEHNVPDWYTWSCETIKYMFPKAHAAAYVMMAFRIGYYKIYYPLEYYAAYFSVRAKFSYEKMCMGKDICLENIYEINEKSKTKKLSPEDKKLLRDLKIVYEMYQRGYSFLPIDLYESHSSEFKIIDGKILPPFIAIEGLGEKVGQTIFEAAKESKFLSKDDLKTRGKVDTTTISNMEKLGLLDGMPQSNQLSFFD